MTEHDLALDVIPAPRSSPNKLNEAYKFHESQMEQNYESRIINVAKSTFSS